MGVNAQTSVPVFTAGQILTAQQQTEINTGIPVFATTTTRDAAFGGTGEKTLAEGQYAYIEATDSTQFYDGTTWQTLGYALRLIKAQTVGTAVTSVTVSDVFSATFDAYLITISGGTSSSAAVGFDMRLGATTTGYYYAYNQITYAGVTGSNDSAANAGQVRFGFGSTDGAGVVVQVINPFGAFKTVFLPNAATLPTTTGYTQSGGGFLNNTTSYTAFTVLPSVGTLTGQIIRVYGYQNS